MENIKKTAIILASYGSPESKDDLPEYLREVFNGRDPPEFAVLDTQKKYAIVKYISPSGQIIRNLRDELEKMMMTETGLKDVQIVNAFKHWKPSLVETIRIFAVFFIFSNYVPLLRCFSMFSGQFQVKLRGQD